MRMTLEEAIEHAEDIAISAIGCECRDEHRQLVAWLRELQERREAPEIVRCGECIHFQCNMRFDGYVPKGADAYECRRGCGGCDPMDYCSYGKRREGRTE